MDCAFDCVSGKNDELAVAARKTFFKEVKSFGLWLLRCPRKLNVEDIFGGI